MYILLSIPFLAAFLYYLAVKKIADCFTKISEDEYTLDEQRAAVWSAIAIIGFYVGYPLIWLRRTLARISFRWS